jgi:hypothetical protein
MKLKKYKVIKKQRKKSKAIMVNLTNLLPAIWDHDNSIKKKHKKNEVKGLITKYQMMNLKIIINFQ